ncbi:zinc-binding dehydrogenase [Streptomyces sp. NPDC006261]|uniref:alcohol dehydrogenase catalytic domain-containing protein n=1 Tax=Streptomyces sp. NPDC006261 TaxID=3156739 RepID=UPI0033B389C9
MSEPTSPAGEPSPRTMRAIVVSETGGTDKLVATDLPLPPLRPDWVRIKVRAFGVNESEVTTRKGLSGPDVTYPRVPGIECAGVVAEAPAGSGLTSGQQVATMMGGMGRSYDGAYAEYVLVPASQVIPFTSDLPWETLGALPEMVQTAYGSLSTGLDLRPGQSLLIRGGTSTVGLTAAAIAKDLGATVLSTTRRPDRADMLREAGVDHPVVDHGEIAGSVREIFPDGVDAALELVGAGHLHDTLRAVRVHGTLCFTGALADQWTIPDFSPLGFIPNGVRLTAYGGAATDLSADVLDHQLRAIADGRLKVSVAKIYHGLESVREAQADLESGAYPGKHVVVLD